jgi:magnesium transporter
MRLQPTYLDVRRLRRWLADGNLQEAESAVIALSPTELADVLLQLDALELARLQQLLGPQRLADGMAELDPSEAARLISRFSRAIAADILEDMEPDDATDVVEELKPAEAEQILDEMDHADAAEIRELLAYPADTAGGRMTTEYVSIGPELTVASALRVLRTQAPDAETIYYIYVTDRGEHLLGVVSLRDLVIAEPTARIAAIMRRQVLHVPADADQEAAARLLVDHNLLALPVVDAAGRIVGVITVDDIADVIEEEATEDIEKLGGSQPLEMPYVQASILQLARKRIPWLLALFLAEAYTGTVLRHYEDTIAAVVSLSFFIPLLIGTGGNVGSQITTTLTRALAVGDIQFRDLWSVLRKEVAVGLLLGVIMAVATFGRAWMLGVEPQVQEVVAITAAFVVVWSSAVASVLPLLLRRIGVDPAVVSAPFITTLVDGTGLIIYFTVADRLLQIR